MYLVPLDESGRKRCPVCKTYKEFDKFNIQNNKPPYNLTAMCKDCASKKTREKYAELGTNHYREKHLMKAYGISLQEYNRLFEEQKGLCAICKKPENRKAGRKRKELENTDIRENNLHVDHSHNTGAIRGLLCSACNQALGLLEEDKERIISLLAYIDNAEQAR